MIRAVFRLALAGCIAFSFTETASSQPSGAMAKVSGWMGQASSVPVYSADGAPRGRQDLSRVAISGLRQWNPDFDLVKISSDPGDDRWVPAKHLNLVFCEPIAENRSAPGVGRPANNKALSYGSGEKCRQ